MTEEFSRDREFSVVTEFGLWERICVATGFSRRNRDWPRTGFFCRAKVFLCCDRELAEGRISLLRSNIFMSRQCFPM